MLVVRVVREDTKQVTISVTCEALEVKLRQLTKVQKAKQRMESRKARTKENGVTRDSAELGEAHPSQPNS